jgi:hypothetical protein
MLPRTRWIPLLLLLLLFPALCVTAGTIPDLEVSAAQRSLALRQIAEHLRAGYIYPEKGDRFAAEITKAAAADRFADNDRLPAFVTAVNHYLLELSDDRHLRLGFGDTRQHPETRRRVVRTEGAEAQPGAHRQARPLPDGDGDEHHGFVEVRVLDGNLGYVDLRGFSDESAKGKADEAMLALAGTDALILDLRRNGGGGPYMVRYLSGFLFEQPTHLASTFRRGMDAPRERWTLHDGRPTDAFVDKPVYVLTSRRTFSAAESFTFGLKVNDRITIVGERTGGGGHFGETLELDGGFRLFLPKGRTYDPKTGKGWEAEGIPPDVEAAADDALEVAIREAKKLRARRGHRQ